MADLMVGVMNVLGSMGASLEFSLMLPACGLASSFFPFSKRGTVFECKSNHLNRENKALLRFELVFR